MNQATDGGRHTAASTTAGLTVKQESSSNSREYRGSEYSPGSVEYSQGDFQTSPLHYDPQTIPGQHLIAPHQRSHHVSHQNQQHSASYLDRVGMSRASMTAYDPTILPGSINTTANQSRSSSSSLTQPTSPVMTSYYPTSNIQAQQQLIYPTSYTHFQPQQTAIDPSSPAYHLMSTMGGGAAAVDANAMGVMQSMDGSQMHSSASVANNSSPLNVNSPPDSSMDSGMFYHQHQYSATPMGGTYRPQQSYYPNATLSAPSQSAHYPSMMTSMQGYPQSPYAAHQNFGIHQSRYAINPYAPQQTTNAAYFSGNQQQHRSGQAPQQWRSGNVAANYYPYQPTPSMPTPTKRGSHGTPLLSSRTRNQNQPLPSSSTLPMRPGNTSSYVRSTSESGRKEGDKARSSEASPSGSVADKGTARVPGKGLRPHYHPQQGPRSDFVLWCGNVPSDSTVEELWSFFSQLPPDPNAHSGEKEDEEVVEEEGDNDPAMSPRFGHGVLSVFIIARSNCAFVNYASTRHLQRAVDYFHGQSLRPADSRCPKLVCRVRKKDDEAQAGVAGQRGRGIHVAWVKEQDRKMKQKSRSTSLAEVIPQDQIEAPTGQQISRDPLSPDSSTTTRSSAPLAPLDSDTSLPTMEGVPSAPEQGGMPITPLERTNVSISSHEDSSGSLSYTSTNSSLFRHPAFHERFFILKSLGTDDLQRSVQTGLWATQPHNEQVLDQAYRNSDSVFLIFSANQSGGFYGYARMAGPILSSREKQQQQLTGLDSTLINTGGSTSSARISRPAAIPEGDEAVKADSETAVPPSMSHIELPNQSSTSIPPSNLLSPGVDGTNLAISSPQQLSPAIEVQSPLPRITSNKENLTWPVQKAKEAVEESLERVQRGQTLSPNTVLLSSRPAQAIPTLTESTVPTLITTSALETSIPRQEDSPLEPADVDEHGVRRKDMASTNIVSYSSDGGMRGNGSLSQAGSLGPTDSASYPDTKLQHHLALRALIHNLRLEERESVMQAEQLEKRMMEATLVSGGTNSDQTSTPRADSSDSWGRPFKVEWKKVTSLAFSQVRKLRNPWRDNRQVKVSRDGTELEPNVGRQLLKEWDRIDALAESLPTPGGDDDEDEDEDR